MEILNEKIKKFLNISSGYGDGDGSGYGSSYGSGYGDGDDSGDSYGSGYGNGFGSGYGNEDGFGYGYGDSSGYGYSYGDGHGDGDGSDNRIKKFNNNIVFLIDEVPTIICHVFKNIAKGYILNTDFTLKPCFVAKGNNLFAHGETIKEANNALQEKIFKNMNAEEAINEFVKKFKKDIKYKGEEFYLWHHILTGSCKMGRDSFVTNNNINLNDEFTVMEFINKCENSYGGEIIKKLKKYYK